MALQTLQARRWLARDHQHHHPTSIVEIRGKATTPAAFYLDWDDVDIEKVPQYERAMWIFSQSRYLAHLASVVIPSLIKDKDTPFNIVVTCLLLNHTPISSARHRLGPVRDPTLES